MIPKGTAVDFVVSVTVNGIAKTGLTVNCSIRRKRDGYYFNGTTWVSSETWLATIEQQTGLYVYSFDHDNYDNSEPDQYTVVFKCEDSLAPFVVSDVYVFSDVETSIVNAVWDEKISNHTSYGSTGYYLRYASKKQKLIWTAKEKAELLSSIDEIKETLDKLKSQKQKFDMNDVIESLNSITEKLIQMPSPTPPKIIKNEINDKKLVEKMHTLYKQEMKKYNDAISDIANDTNKLIKKFDTLLNKENNKEYKLIMNELNKLSKLIIASAPTEALERVISDDK